VTHFSRQFRREGEMRLGHKNLLAYILAIDVLDFALEMVELKLEGLELPRNFVLFGLHEHGVFGGVELLRSDRKDQGVCALPDHR
jgi:hypothetical protein